MDLVHNVNKNRNNKIVHNVNKNRNNKRRSYGEWIHENSKSVEEWWMRISPASFMCLGPSIFTSKLLSWFSLQIRVWKVSQEPFKMVHKSFLYAPKIFSHKIALKNKHSIFTAATLERGLMKQISCSLFQGYARVQGRTLEHAPLPDLRVFDWSTLELIGARSSVVPFCWIWLLWLTNARAWFLFLQILSSSFGASILQTKRPKISEQSFKNIKKFIPSICKTKILI